MLVGGLVVCEELHNLGLIDSSVVVVLTPLLLFLSINVHTNNKKFQGMSSLARPVMGTIFLVTANTVLKLLSSAWLLVYSRRFSIKCCHLIHRYQGI